MEFFFRNGLAESTQRSYNSAKRQYIHFCKSHNMSPIPASERQLGQYVSYLALANLAHSTIKCYLAAVRHLHIAEGAADPQISRMARLEQILRGIKLTQAKGTGRRKERPSQTKRGVAGGSSSHALGSSHSLFFGGAGELTIRTESGYDVSAHVSFQDVSIDSLTTPQTLQVRLKSSKTDPFRTGVDVFVGRTYCSLCPVTAVLDYMTRRGSAPGPLFIFTDGKPLTRARFVAEVKAALSWAGVDSTCYSGHSFRSGAATTARNWGCDNKDVRSSTYQVYIKTPRAQLAKVSQTLAGGTRQKCQ